MKTSTLPRIPSWGAALVELSEQWKRNQKLQKTNELQYKKILKLEKRAKERNKEMRQMRKYIKMMEQANEKMQAIAYPESSEVRGAYSLTATELVNHPPKSRGEY